MANMIDYAQKHGNDNFTKLPFNDIDGVILAQLAYLDFGVLAQHSVNRLRDLTDPTLIKMAVTDTWNPAGNAELLTLINHLDRFQNISWHHWLAKVDVEKEQKITVITFTLAPDLHYVSFRGTTATLIDWKEDLNMTFLPAIPSQRTALHYTRDLFKELPGEFYLGGHSKGGNLAVYVLTHASAAMQQRIRMVYSADGPGLKQEVPATLLPKVHKIIPQSSIIGLLLEPDSEYQIVASDARGFKQHDPYTWQVVDHKFNIIATTGRMSQYTQRSIARWLTEVDDDTKQDFLESIYDLFTATNHQEITYLEENWPETLRVVLRGMNEAQPTTKRQWREVNKKLVQSLIAEAGLSVRQTIDQVKPSQLGTEAKSFLNKYRDERRANKSDSMSTAQPNKQN